jgi:hypothetical protein
MTNTSIRFARTLMALAAAASLVACGTALRVGGAPQKSVDNCVTAAAREFKVPASAVAVAGSSSPRDLLYSVDLRVGPQGRSAVCTVNENGEVMGVVFKRPT